MKKGKAKRDKFDWPPGPHSKPHVRNWFRSLGSKKLKGAARERKMDALMDALMDELTSPPHK